MKLREDLSGEPCFPALAFSLKGGDVLYEPSCLPLRLLNQAETFITDLVLTPPGEMRILTGEPYFLPLAFSLKKMEGGGRSPRTILPSFETSNLWGRFITDFTLAM